MAITRKRLSLVEYGSSVDLSNEIATVLGIDRTKVEILLADAGNRVAASLGLKYNPITFDRNGIRAIDFAGLVRLAPSIELEVAPKFLGLDDTDATWREDFFFLSTLSRHGRLLANERLSASGGAPRDLSTLIARSFISMYEGRKRSPLRSYRKAIEADFYIDGDADPMDLVFPSSDGFNQEVIRFDRKNEWNANIMAAAKELLFEVSDPSTAGSLMRLIEDLSPQYSYANRSKAIPARYRAWQPLHELSIDILSGLGINYKQGQAHAPGYVVSTWRIWEDLLAIAARIGFGQSSVISQKGFVLGERTKLTTNTASPLSVFPDCIVEAAEGRSRIILDSKYKGHVEKGQLRLAEADIYEALAFSKATRCDRVILAHPARPLGKVARLGGIAVFEIIRVDAVCIAGIQVESRGISKRGALKIFATNFARELTHLKF